MGVSPPGLMYYTIVPLVLQYYRYDGPPMYIGGGALSIYMGEGGPLHIHIPILSSAIWDVRHSLPPSTNRRQ